MAAPEASRGSMGGGFHTKHMRLRQRVESVKKQSSTEVLGTRSKFAEVVRLPEGAEGGGVDVLPKILEISAGPPKRLKKIIDELYEKEKRYVRQYIREDYIEKNNCIFDLQKLHQTKAHVGERNEKLGKPRKFFTAGSSKSAFR